MNGDKGCDSAIVKRHYHGLQTLVRDEQETISSYRHERAEYNPVEPAACAAAAANLEPVCHHFDILLSSYALSSYAPMLLAPE